MYNIAEFSKRSGVTTTTLMLWEQLSVLVPARTDSVSGNKYYNDAQLQSAREIIRLKDIGFSNPEITGILKAPLTRERLIEQRAVFNKQIEDAQKNLEKLNKYIKEITSLDTAQIVSLPGAYYFCSRRVFSDPQDLTIEYLNVLDKMKSIGIEPKKPLNKSAVFHKKECILENYEASCLVEVEPNEYGRDEAVVYIPGVREAALITHTDSVDLMPDSYKLLYEWIEKSNYEVAGEPRERYMLAGRDLVTNFMVEIYIPISRKGLTK